MAERDEIWQVPLDLAAYPTLTGSFASLTQALQEHRIAFGSGGFCVETKQRLAEGPVNINLDFKGEQYALSGQGIVRWFLNDANQVGVELTDISGEECRERVLERRAGACLYTKCDANIISGWLRRSRKLIRLRTSCDDHASGKGLIPGRRDHQG